MAWPRQGRLQPDLWTSCSQQGKACSDEAAVQSRLDLLNSCCEELMTICSRLNFHPRNFPEVDVSGADHAGELEHAPDTHTTEQ